MFAMSVNDVPGWLVTIPPSAMGVPVAFAPGLVPHCDVLTAGAELAALPGDADVPAGELAALPHPAAAIIPIAAVRAMPGHRPGACLRILIYPASLGVRRAIRRRARC